MPLWVFMSYGRLSIAPGFRFIAVFVLVSTVIVMWMAVRLKRVGYCGRELVVANYWREARVPFEQVEAVEPVWWFRSRLVRIVSAGPRRWDPACTTCRNGVHCERCSRTLERTFRGCSGPRSVKPRKPVTQTSEHCV